MQLGEDHDDFGALKLTWSDSTMRFLRPTERPLASLLRAASNPDQYPPHRSIMALDFASRNVPDDYRPLLHRLRATAYLEAGQPYRSAMERIELGAFLLDPIVARDNREQIIAALQRLTALQVQSYLQLHHPDDEMFGWLALVEMVKIDVFGGTAGRRSTCFLAFAFSAAPGQSR